MHGEWTDRLSDYIDDDLPAAERDAVAAHLRTCAQCRTVLEDLRHVQREAQQLPQPAQERDAWPEIEARIGRRSRVRGMSWPIGVAAGFILAVVSGAGVWLVSRPGPETSGLPAGSSPEPAAMRVSVPTAPYDRAIADLLHTLRTERNDLDPRTVEAVERSLATIDAAIADAQAALAADPGDGELLEYLAGRQRSRLAALRQFERVAFALQ